jgi:hypothetical protein
MSYTISAASLDDLLSYRADARSGLDWSSVFVLPEWMQVWWQVFGPLGAAAAYSAGRG